MYLVVYPASSIALTIRKLKPLQASDLIGAPEEIRTPDPQIRSLVLFGMSLPFVNQKRVQKTDASSSRLVILTKSKVRA